MKNIFNIVICLQTGSHKTALVGEILKRRRFSKDTHVNNGEDNNTSI